MQSQKSLLWEVRRIKAEHAENVRLLSDALLLIEEWMCNPSGDLMTRSNDLLTRMGRGFDIAEGDTQ